MADPFYKRNERILRVPLFIRLLFVLPALIIPIYWMVTDTGLWRIISNFQAEYLFKGGHYIFLTGALCFLATVGVALGAVWLIALFFKAEEA